MNVLVTGASGQLGSEIRDIAGNYTNCNFIFKDLHELDICNVEQLNDCIQNENIHVAINCAAYTAVDKAEEAEEISQKVNALGVQNLVNALTNVDGKLIHISTDYVFNGDSYLPYQETDEVDPIGVYGNTKREGELAVINSDIDGIILRTSWLYSSHGNNFVKTMMRLGKDRDFLGVIFDQVGTPTYARDLAKACIDIICGKEERTISEKGKVYHFSNEGVASWYDFAKEIMKIGNIDCQLNPIETKDYPTPAKRPHYSVLNKSKIKEDFNVEVPYWKDSLEACVKQIEKA